jgi:hypothetical protein
MQIMQLHYKMVYPKHAMHIHDGSLAFIRQAQAEKLRRLLIFD